MQDIVHGYEGEPLKPLSPLAVAMSGVLGYTAVSQIMLFNSRPDWFNEISEANMKLQEDVMDTYVNVCWQHDCLLDQHFNLVLQQHVEENWLRFFCSAIMPIPLEGF